MIAHYWKHRERTKINGVDILSVDIMDEDGDANLQLKRAAHLNEEVAMGKSILNYDSMLVLAHFKRARVDKPAAPEHREAVLPAKAGKTPGSR